MEVDGVDFVVARERPHLCARLEKFETVIGRCLGYYGENLNHKNFIVGSVSLILFSYITHTSSSVHTTRRAYSL